MSATDAISRGGPPPVQPQNLAKNGVSDLVGGIHFLKLRVLQPKPVLEDRVRQHVDVLVNRARHKEPTALAVVRRYVGSSPSEADSQRGPGKDDAHVRHRTVYRRLR